MTLRPGSPTGPPARGRVTPGRWIALALGALGFPVVWPLSALRRWVRIGQFEAARARVVRSQHAEALVVRVRRGEARRAVSRVVTFSTIASGPDQDGVLEVELSDGTRAAIDERDHHAATLREALAAHGLALERVETHRYGIAAPFLWGLWLASVLAVWALVTSSTAPAVVALLVLAGLAALAMM